MTAGCHTLADDVSLVESLRFTVPLRLADLLARPERERAPVARRWSADGARAVGERGDLLQFVNRNRSSTTSMKVANTFNALARGLAALVVLHPAGVDVAGLHWCLNPDCGRCYPPRPEPTLTLAGINARLEALDADYRQVCGLPPWTPPTSQPDPAPPARTRRQPVVDVHLPEAA